MIEKLAPKCHKATSTKGPEGYFESEARAAFWLAEIESGNYQSIAEAME